MSFWLGVTLTLAVYNALQAVLSVALFGSEIEVDRRFVAGKIVFMVVFFVIANLVHIGVIL